jgi:hypothetical protein
MDVFAVLFTQPWRAGTGVIIGLAGLVVFYNGLAGTHGLLRRRTALVERLKGWQHVLFGLTLLGLAISWALGSRLFLFLTLGIAFTELREASAIISAMKHERRRRVDAGATPP